MPFLRIPLLFWGIHYVVHKNVFVIVWIFSQLNSIQWYSALHFRKLDQFSTWKFDLRKLFNTRKHKIIVQCNRKKDTLKQIIHYSIYLPIVSFSLAHNKNNLLNTKSMILSIRSHSYVYSKASWSPKISCSSLVNVLKSSLYKTISSSRSEDLLQKNNRTSVSWNTVLFSCVGMVARPRRGLITLFKSNRLNQTTHGVSMPAIL